MPLPEELVTGLQEAFPEDEYVQTWIRREDLRSIRNYLENQAKKQLDPEETIENIGAGLGGRTVHQAKRIIAARDLLKICPRVS